MSNVSDFLATKTLPPVPLTGSNGFFNRKMFTAPGLHSLIVPPGVFRVKLANLGGGGSGGGAYTNYYSGSYSGQKAAYGGGGGGLAILYELVVAPGDVLDIVVGAGGDAIVAPNIAPYRLVGNPGGITSISRNGIVLLQSTGGLGGTGRNAGEVITVHKATQIGTNPYKNSQAFAFVGANDWWDLDDIGGWGAGYRVAAGPGGGGAGRQGGPDGLPGFGGGGAGGHNDRAQDGGIGAGGGAYIGTNSSNSSGKGGDGCAIVWW